MHINIFTVCECCETSFGVALRQLVCLVTVSSYWEHLPCDFLHCLKHGWLCYFTYHAEKP